MKSDLQDKILAAAISAVLLFEPQESIIRVSPGRNKVVYGFKNILGQLLVRPVCQTREVKEVY